MTMLHVELCSRTVFNAWESNYTLKLHFVINCVVQHNDCSEGAPGMSWVCPIT